MAFAVFLLLLATWMAELGLIGLRWATLAGAILMAASAGVLTAAYLRSIRNSQARALAALARVAGNPRPRRPVGVRTVTAR